MGTKITIDRKTGKVIKTEYIDTGPFDEEKAIWTLAKLVVDIIYKEADAKRAPKRGSRNY